MMWIIHEYIALKVFSDNVLQASRSRAGNGDQLGHSSARPLSLAVTWVRRRFRKPTGAKIIYDGEILTIIEMFPDKRGTEVLVADRGGTRRLWIGLRELITRGHAMAIGDDDCPRSDDPGEAASVALSRLDEAARQVVAERAGHVREVVTGYELGFGCAGFAR